MEKNDKEFDWSGLFSGIAVCGSALPFYLLFAPKWFREDLVEYTGKFIGGVILFAVLMGILYVLYMLFLKKE